jgi:Ankyrin repeat
MSRTQIVIDQRDEGGNTQLMRSALDGHTEAVKDLLRKGANVNAQNREGDAVGIQTFGSRHFGTSQRDQRIFWCLFGVDYGESTRER